MTQEEKATIQDELDYLAYWEDDAVEDRLDAELQRYMRIYAGVEQEETMWQQMTSSHQMH